MPRENRYHKLFSGLGFEPSRATLSWFFDMNGFYTKYAFLTNEFIKALLELLYGIPFGQQESLNNSTKSIMSIRPKENVKSELRRLKLEQQHIQRRVREILSVEFFKLDFLSHNFLLKRNSFLLISTYVKKSTEIDFQIRFGIDTD